MQTLDRKLLRDLRQLWAQVLTIGMVIACGVGVFVGSFSTHESIALARDAYYQTSRFADVFASVKRVPDAAAADILKLPGIAEVQTRQLFTAQIELTNIKRPLGGAIVGLETQTDAIAGSLNRIGLRQGNWPVSGRSQVLVHEGIAKARDIRLGDEVRMLLNGRVEIFTVSGIGISPEYVFPAAVFGAFDETSFGVFWIDRERLAAAFDERGTFNQVAVKLIPGASEADVIGQLDRFLRPFGSAITVAREDQGSHVVVTSEIDQQQVFGIALPVVFILVAVFVINTVISRQVTTQRDQIAALKALGYDDWSIIGYYLKLAALIVLLGAVLGAVIGIIYGRFMLGLYEEVFRFARFDYVISAWVIFMPSLVNLLAAILGTFYATRSILKLSPAQAMRPPAPIAYRRTLLQRISLGDHLSPTTNMILRHVERHPGRTALAVLGITGAVGILFSGTWWRDGLDHLIRVQYGQVERADVQVSFYEPISRDVKHGLMQLPGVKQVETIRQVPIRLSNGHLERRTVVVGIINNRRLLRLLDENQQLVVVPPNGLILGRKLADRLQAGAGDELTMAFVSERAPPATVTVTGVVDEMIGITAYMDAVRLDQLAGDKATITSAALSIDSTRLDELFAVIKKIPRISGVAVNSELIKHFNDNAARNILIFTAILTVFASFIAVGVVYNSARISLAERAWEFATLRVLGLTEAEVGRLLNGELLIGLGIGIPVGWVFGWLMSWGLLQAMTSSNDLFALPHTIWPRTYAYAALVMLIAGLATGLTVRRRLGRLDLIAVLKTRE
ncbi:MAG: ABC transporter permease [Burkholderiaceae bacterium]